VHLALLYGPDGLSLRAAAGFAAHASMAELRDVIPARPQAHLFRADGSAINSTRAHRRIYALFMPRP